MGSGTWSSDAYRDLTSSKSYKTKSAGEIFSSGLHADMDPVGVKFRESRDSDEHPESLPIAVFLDVTGSMGSIPVNLVKGKLGALMETVLAHGIPHPQILFGAIGDHISDRAPLQVGQFESDTTKIDECLTKVYIEKGGGGGCWESYSLAWLFCARHTSIDSFEKRGVKGFLFTIGDERFHMGLGAEQLRRIMGAGESELDSVELLREAQRTYHVFHIHINEASYKNDDKVFAQWRNAIGQNFLVLDDHEAVGELIASTVAVVHGADIKDVTAGFDKHTASLVANALVNVTKDVTPTGRKEGIVKL